VEGAIGMAVGLGSRSSFICALVQVSGTSIRIPASRFRAVANRSPGIRELIVRYAELQLGQIQQTAACNALHQVSERLSRWLLQTSDKTASNTIPFTHEFLGRMLGVRRSTVSQIASEFHDAGIIETRRGQITVLKRKELEKKACDCYEIIRLHIDRLLPPADRSADCTKKITFKMNVLQIAMAGLLPGCRLSVGNRTDGSAAEMLNESIVGSECRPPCRSGPT
jgi:DNA-binding transcriptional regulator YhcF (GntR family)